MITNSRHLMDRIKNLVGGSCGDLCQERNKSVT